MHQPSLWRVSIPLLLPLLARGAVAAVAAAADSTGTAEPTTTTVATTAPIPSCTATSSTGSGAFFDLRPEMAVPPIDDSSFSGQQQQVPPPSAGQPTTDYKARGWDYGMNFTLNLCGPVVDPIRDVVGVDETLWKNVSAYYTTAGGDRISIGQQSMDLVSRGRKLVLKYTDGSPCDEEESLDPKTQKNHKRSTPVVDPVAYRYSEYADEPETGAIDFEPVDRDSKSNPSVSSSSKYSTTYASSSSALSSTARRKSTLISFHCDRDPSLKQAAVSFVGTPDNCAYFFEVRSQHACARAEPDKPGSVGPGGVFALILSIAIIVYVLGGVFYNRTVTHARGWRQLPNYSLWAGIWNTFVVSLPCLALPLLPVSPAPPYSSRMSPPLPRYQPGGGDLWKPGGRNLR